MIVVSEQNRKRRENWNSASLLTRRWKKNVNDAKWNKAIYNKDKLSVNVSVLFVNFAIRLSRSLFIFLFLKCPYVNGQQKWQRQNGLVLILCHRFSKDDRVYILHKLIVPISKNWRYKRFTISHFLWLQLIWLHIKCRFILIR